MDISNKIRSLREDNDFTQQEIADLLGIQQTVYSRYETERSQLPVHHLYKLCLIYKVSSDYILGLPKGLNHPER